MNQGKYVFSQITEFISQRCWDLDRLYRFGLLNSFFVIREKRRPKFEVPEGEDLLEGPDNIRQLFQAVEAEQTYVDGQLKLEFYYCQH